MINKYLWSGLLLGLMMVSTLSLAEVKLGYVNAAMLLDESPQAQKASRRLQEEFSGRQKNLLAAKERFDELKARLGRDGAIMSESANKKLRLDILSRQRDLMRDDEALRQDLAIRRNDIMGGLQLLIRKAIDDVGKKGAYDIIFYEGIAYANTTLDISDQVLNELKRLDAEASN